MLRVSTAVAAAPPVVAVLLSIIMSSCSSKPPFRSPRRLPGAVSNGGGDVAELHSASAQEVARRALILRSLAAVDVYPRSDEQFSPEVIQHLETERAELVKWLEKEGAWGEATEREKEILTTRVGTRKRDEGRADESPREPLLVMLWSLGLVEAMPPYDTPAPPVNRLNRYLPAIGEPTEKLVRGAELRPEAEIEREWETAELWHWRARAREVMRDKRYPQGRELDSQVQALTEQAREDGFRLKPIRDGETFFQELVRFAAHYGHRQGLIPPPIGEDFPAKKKSYADLDEKEFESVRRLAAERHHALRWVRGEE